MLVQLGLFSHDEIQEVIDYLFPVLGEAEIRAVAQSGADSSKKSGIKAQLSSWGQVRKCNLWFVATLVIFDTFYIIASNIFAIIKKLW